MSVCVFVCVSTVNRLLLINQYCDHQVTFLCLSGLPSFGVVNLTVATGPFPSSVTALTWKVYDVQGFSCNILTDVALASVTEISR